MQIIGKKVFANLAESENKSVVRLIVNAVYRPLFLVRLFYPPKAEMIVCYFQKG